MSTSLEKSIPEIDRKRYAEEYDEMECKNLSLVEYMTMQYEIKLNETRDLAKYDTLGTGLPQMNSARVPAIAPERCVHRTIIIDGANVMHGGSTYHDTRQGKSHVKIPDVAALLSIVRYFVVRNFEVIVVISRKYTIRDATNYKSAIEDLIRNHICMIAPKTNLDDTICLDLAAQLNGVVVTSDKFRDHANESERYRRIVNENRLRIEWNEVSDRNKNKKTNEGDFVAGKRFGFYNDNEGEMNSEEVQTKIFAKPESIVFEVSRERYQLSQPEKKKNKILALLSNLIHDGFTICPETANDIIKRPLPGPKAPKEEELDARVVEVHEDPDRGLIAYCGSDESL